MAASMGKTQLMMKMKMMARGGHAFSSKSYQKSVRIEINKVVVGSHIQWRGKSYTASVASSDIPSDAQKRRRRVSKDERQAMVESFVNKYREMNGGKFPNLSFAQKQVGGCYYNVRKIIQELKHKSKMSSSDISKESPSRESKVSGSQISGAQKTLSKEGFHSSLVATQSNLLKGEAIACPLFEKPKDNEVKEAQENHRLKEETKLVSYQSIEISDTGNTKDVSPSGLKKAEDDKEGKALLNDFDFVPAEGHLLKGDVEKEEAQGGHSGYAVTESCLLMRESKKGLPTCPENAEDKRKEQAVSEDLANDDSLEFRAEQYQGSIELEKVAKDTSTRQKTDAEVPKKSSLWKSLKSFADGFVNIWRKM
ncbi:uncharacterized protein LOC121244628 isoform X1 [Juglans microcarpa x Juglans regia]|uniref:uncharacterized protein LOC121244628 isoform X1 n=1 Tax=Juglans microcarpa x Juglans regia TaxID=2249226 RepID=UPI001B7E9F21|nr:uncharacterized protein LOC121244628 isoform X1 [Juglans microcarpa x Juglans regia]